MQYRLPDNQLSRLRKCKHDASMASTVDVITECNITGEWRTYDESVKRACMMLDSHITETHTYKNVFCFFCNHDLTWSDVSNEILFRSLSLILFISTRYKYHFQMKYFELCNLKDKDMNHKSIHYENSDIS